MNGVRVAAEVGLGVGSPQSRQPASPSPGRVVANGVDVAVTVAIDTVAVGVAGVAVAIGVAVAVSLAVAVGVAVAVAVFVGVSEGGAVGVREGARVGVGASVSVAVAVCVGLIVGTIAVGVLVLVGVGPGKKYSAHERMPMAMANMTARKNTIIRVMAVLFSCTWEPLYLQDDNLANCQRQCYEKG